jgi:hypothetical protein
MSLASDSVVEVMLVGRSGVFDVDACLRTGVSVPVVLLLDLGALLLGVEILIGDLFELDHFGGCVWGFEVLKEWWRIDMSFGCRWVVVVVFDVSRAAAEVRSQKCLTRRKHEPDISRLRQREHLEADV